MKRALLVVSLVSASVSQAQVSLSVAIPAPVIRFEAEPAVVEVSPGVRVVPDCDDEVFFDHGYYFTRRDGRWWRTRDYRGGWAVVERRYVPMAVYRVPPGQYRRWHRDERREARREDKEWRKEQKHREKDYRREEARPVRYVDPPPPARGPGPVREVPPPPGDRHHGHH